MQGPRQLQPRSSASAAFSLIELLVVMAILVILTTMFWGRGPSKRDVQLAACRGNLEKVFLAMEVYAHDNSDKFPVATNAVTSEDPLSLLVPRDTSDTAAFICPAAGGSSPPPNKSLRDGKISYAYYMGRHSSESDQALMSDVQINELPKSLGDQVFSDKGKAPGNNHGKGGGNFLMCNGSVTASGNSAPVSLTFKPPVALLNPKP